MAAEAVAWNVVVLGSWNIAILTPRGIATKLFELPEGAAVEVQVQVERPGAPRVVHGGLAVLPSSEQLVIEPQVPDRDLLVKATAIAKRAVESLPNTPMFAAGVNLRYHTSASELSRIFQSPADGQFAEADLQTVTRTIGREFSWREGILNFQAKEESRSGDIAIVLNFHRESTNPPELAMWLSRASEMINFATVFVRKTLQLDMGGEQ